METSNSITQSAVGLATAPQDLGSIDLSDFKKLVEEAKQSNDSLAIKEGFGSGSGDRRWQAHVEGKFGSSDRLSWNYPLTKADKERLAKEGVEEPNEVSPIPEHHFVALRGVVVKVAYGFRMSGKVGDKFTNFCQTTALIDQDSGTTITDSHPLEIPINKINQSKKNPHTINSWLAERPWLTLKGSRPPVGTPEGVKTSETRTCAECVAAGEHYVGTLDQFQDPNTEIPKCKLEGYLKFCVFQLGILDSSAVLKGGKPTIKWVDVKDANLTYYHPTGFSAQREAPFILKIAGMGPVQHRSLGSGDYERDIVTNGRQCYLPEGAQYYSWGDYYRNYLNARNVTGEPRRLALFGNTVFPVVTEVHLAKLKKPEFGATHLPVFCPVTDPNVISRGEGLTPIDWLQLSLQCLQYEEALINGEVNPVDSTSSPQALPTSASEACPMPQPNKEEADTPVEVEVVEEEVVKPTTSFSAFTAPAPDID
jgi:hypothetical protein